MRALGCAALVVVAAVASAAAEPALVLPDGNEIAIVSDIADVPSEATVDIQMHEVEVQIRTVGKANTLSRDLIAGVARVDKKLGAQLRGIKTSFVLVQGDDEHYIRVLPSIAASRYRKPRNVVATIAIVTVTTGEGTTSIPFITAVRDARGR